MASINSPSAVSTDDPPGWTYNPSAWSERIPIAAAAVIGLGIAVYLSLFQLNVVGSVWDPFFGSASSEKILTSSLSRVLPIPDAALGAISYLLDAVSGVIGKTRRWKTMPWIVLVFGFAVGPLGVTSLFLVIAQPVFFQAWCSLCLASAVISTVMIGPAMDEVLASLQYLQRVKRSGFSVWKALWGDAEINRQVA
ncbi:hypothetical protein GCM10023187_06230 [Nibrella viscosa]|uniref:Vitamin K epoxide reductase domain-containing protein n=1 Tax=Nibrella viscosa TaxID=1084524 RepID=A0ABP8JXC8_9BACT